MTDQNHNAGRQLLHSKYKYLWNFLVFIVRLNVCVGDMIIVFIYTALFRDRVYKVLQKEDSQVMSGPDKKNNHIERLVMN